MAMTTGVFPVLPPPQPCRHLRPSSRTFSLPFPAASFSPSLPTTARGQKKPTSRWNGRQVRCCSTPLPAAEGSDEEISQATLIWRAVKLPMYSVALVPLTVGSTVAHLQTGVFLTSRYIILLLSSVLIIAWLNLSNDVYDYDTGADKNKKESVVNIVGSRNATHVAANVMLVVGFMGLLFASVNSGDIRTIFLLTSAIICGYIYQCPPFRLSYKGLGEPLCFAAFGPYATTAFYFSQGSKHLPSGMVQLPLTGTIVSASALVGLTTSLILFCSHFHQIDGDIAVGKMSPLARIGREAGSEAVKVAVTTLYGLVVVLGLAKFLPLSCVCFAALTLPAGKLVIDYVKENHNDNAKMFMAKYFCVRLHAVFGVALTAGFILVRKGITIQIPGVLVP